MGRTRTMCIVPLAALCAVGTTACATGSGFHSLEAKHETLLSVQESLDSMSQQDPAAFMAADMQFVSFRYTVGDSLLPRRDTLNGVRAAGEWMTKWRARKSSDANVAFTPSDVLRCTDGLVLIGTYELPRASLAKAAERDVYQAHWTTGEDGRWRMDRLWLGPDGPARETWKGKGCQSRRSLELALNRVSLSLEGVWQGAPANDPLMSAMRDFGWRTPPEVAGRQVEYPYAQSTKVALAASATYRITPSLGLQALYVGPRSQTVRGLALGTRPELVTRDQSVAFMGVVQSGLLRIGGGPMLMKVKYDWGPKDSQVVTPSQGSESLRGAIGQLSLTVPFTELLRPTATLRYMWVPDGTAPEFYGFGPTTVPLGGLSLGVGVAAVF